MTARTHDIIAFTSLVTVSVYFPPDKLNLMTLFSAIIAADLGALIPDMDQAGNRIWDLLPAGQTVGKIFRRIFYKHRTITHSLLGLYGIYKGLEFILPKIFNTGFIDPKIILFSVMVGYISHLIADSFTKEGLPLFFPLPVDIGIPPIKAFRIKAGGTVEKFIVFPAVLIYFIWFIYTKQPSLVALLQSVN